jgi:two-component system phosphate regulon response regulator PhoB
VAKTLVLVVEDDLKLAELLKWHLERAGFEVQVTADGEEALVIVRETPPDLIVLDWMLPGLAGIEVCRCLRRMPGTANTPIIMLTAKGEEPDRIRGLETGADDFVTKPFSPRELLARIAAVLRRVRPALAGQVLTCGDLTMDVASHKVQRGGTSLKLAPTEYRLLKHFLEHPGRVFSREQLLNSVWGRDNDIEVRTVDVQIRRLRSILNDGGKPELIRTVRAAGYALDEGEEN